MATALSLLAFVGGYAIAGSLTIAPGPSEAGNGNYETTTSISWWSQASVGITTVPSSLPTSLVATNASAPLTLPSSSSKFLINNGTAGDVAHYFRMTEGTGAATNAELELVFTVSVGTTPVVTTHTVFVETQGTSLSGPLTFTFYYDLGSAASSNIVLNSVQQVSLECSAVGSCP